MITAWARSASASIATIIVLTAAVLASCRTSNRYAIQNVDDPSTMGEAPNNAMPASMELIPSSTQYVEELLRRFDEDSATAMDADLEKFDRQGEQRLELPTFFSSEEIATNRFVVAKDMWRVTKVLCSRESDPRQCLTKTGGRAAIRQNDRPESLVDNGGSILNTLEAMESAELLKAQLAPSPWSDDYWAIYSGILGKRYADPNFPASEDWKENSDYALVNAPAPTINDINLLSPSEKYDLIFGDPNFSLTQSQWAEGKKYYDNTGAVEGWMGICHGWAPAAYMLPRPVRTVMLKTPDGRDIAFYPSDIKSLGTLMYANGSFSSKFIGGRCNDKEPERFPNGRIKSSDCFDNNPGSWHMAIVNQVGISKRSLVIDATYDYEVWNQPLLGYKYRYFDPKTGRTKHTIAEATQALPMAGDKFQANRRNARAKKIVGVSMDVWYIAETSPNQEPEDSDRNDAVTRVTYIYDLELDASGKIIGGEWYSNKHPDFLWTPTPDARIETAGDTMATATWETSAPLPPSWQEAGRIDGSNGTPLAKFVYQLYQAAAQ